MQESFKYLISQGVEIALKNEGLQQHCGLGCFELFYASFSGICFINILYNLDFFQIDVLVY